MLHDDASKNLSKLKTANEAAVETARKRLDDAKVATDWEAKSKTVDDAARKLADSVRRDVVAAEFSEDLVGQVAGVHHDSAIGDYAKYKGKEMQGFASLVSDASVRIGKWSQTREDVNLWVDCLDRHGGARVSSKNTKVFIKPGSVVISHASFAPVVEEKNEEENCLRGNPEFSEFDEASKVEFAKTISHAINELESTWYIDEGQVCINLVKGESGCFWPEICESDGPEASAVCR